ncbi:MAG: preprotein translocase subunit SecA [Dehalococcoidia bacterium]|nr:preprotein translocase subunit SecA [Dehalococcoidia bacterium]
MFNWFTGDSNEREIKKLASTVSRINELEPEFRRLSDVELADRTPEFKKRLADAVAAERSKLEEAKEELAKAQNALCITSELDEKTRRSIECRRLQDGIDALDANLRKAEGKALEELLPEAFAAVREASRRKLGLRHFDVQIMGGMVLHAGRIAEMRTGEGKTLAATLPLYLNALTGRGVHLVTVNDYLARRDPYWMGPVYHSLGLKVASIYPMQNQNEHLPSRLFDPDYDSGLEKDPWRQFRPVTRAEAYQADITYGTSAEFGFDYLRDNMAVDLKQTVQRARNFAIVDEVDNLLIDEARTPLIISAPDVESSQRYQVFAQLVTQLKGVLSKGKGDVEEVVDADYTYNIKDRSTAPTDSGFARIEGLLRRQGVLKADEGLYDLKNADLMRHLRNALNAKEFFKRDHQYMVKDGEVLIVDEFTGRVLVGRRYSEGLHQAIEAKEHVKVQQETKTFATITIQNYFRMYSKLAGMTGTAETEAEEFAKIYKLEVVRIPTHRPMMRRDHGDLIYKDGQTKFKALVKDVEEVQKQGRPVLIGTVAIENSEILSDMLNRRGVKHNVLNAKKHEHEAIIIAGAGEPGAVTVATNMAGRGVDILLGGKPPEGGDERAMAAWQVRHDKVVELGGLYVLGSERHESRRIDNQLRGRAGRQGDPGDSRFYVALDDDLMRRFGGGRIAGVMEWAGMDENTPIENRMISRSIENSQTKVEGYNFDIRKHLVDYDDVLNKQREVIYSERRKILEGADLRSNILDMIHSLIEEECGKYLHVRGEEPDYAALIKAVSAIFAMPDDLTAESLARMKNDDIIAAFDRLADELYAAKEDEVGMDVMRTLERLVMLRVIDTLWVSHLTAVDYIRQGVGLQAMAQQDPLVAYKRQASGMFEELRAAIREDVAHMIYKVKVVKQGPAPPPGAASGTSPISGTAQAPLPSSPMTQIMGKPGVRQPPPGPARNKPGRNEPCPCGSGKKYKHCCGKHD